jgi:CRISPR-associated protein Csd2
MNPRKLVIFKHESHLGNDLAGRLFKRVSITRDSELPRKIEDYSIIVNKDNLPAGITVQEWPEENVF